MYIFKCMHKSCTKIDKHRLECLNEIRLELLILFEKGNLYPEISIKQSGAVQYPSLGLELKVSAIFGNPVRELVNQTNRIGF